MNGYIGTFAWRIQSLREAKREIVQLAFFWQIPQSLLLREIHGKNKS